jgi:lipopolysaccharide export system protein LptC
MMPKVVLDEPTPTLEPEAPIIEVKPPRRRRAKKRGRWVIIVIFMLIAATIGFLIYKFQHPSLPVSVQSSPALADSQSTKAPFAVFHPTGTLKFVEGSSKYDSNLQVATAEFKVPGTETSVTANRTRYYYFTR